MLTMLAQLWAISKPQAGNAAYSCCRHIRETAYAHGSGSINML